MFDLWEDGLDDTLLGDKMFRRKDRDLREFLYECIGQVFDTGDAIDIVSEELESDNRFTR